MSMRDEEKPVGISRAEIETLCVLDAVGPQGCAAGELAGRLGLAASLATAVADGMEALVAQGWLERVEDRFLLTEAGRDYLDARTRALGVR